MRRKFLKSVVLIGGLIIVSAAVLDSGVDRHGRNDSAKRAAPDLKFDQRYNHNRSYPKDGRIVNELPKRRIPIRHHDRDYFYFGGVWYLPSGPNLMVVRPPVGIVVPVLPPYYTTVWLRSRPYYYANDVYYVWRPDMNGYQVTAPPPEAAREQTTYMAEEIFIYPKQGQNEQQQTDDRYACHRWGVEQTGYNPIQPPADLTTHDVSRLRENYQRAMKTCLEAKGYSVQ